jgi:hypothetical protein
LTITKEKQTNNTCIYFYEREGIVFRKFIKND